MTCAPLAEMLAQAPSGPAFVSAWKLAALAIMLGCWPLLAQWVDKDTVAVNTFRVPWNLIVLAAGVIAAAALILADFAIGAPTYAVLMIALVVAYVLHRNGLVREEDKVLTREHLKRVMAEGLASKKGKKQKEVKQRVNLRDAAGKRVAIPEEEEQREQYRLSQDLLFDLLWHRAERVELVPEREAAAVVYYIDGVKSQRDPLDRGEADAIVVYMKTLAGLNLEERRKPQIGKLQVAVGDNKFELEVQTDGSAAGERLALRVIGAEARFKIADLGFTDQQTPIVEELMQASRGLVLVSGPAGSGVTTTIYSFTRSHDAFLQNIQTLEYRIELPIDNVTQMQFEQQPDKTFTGELQKMFRTDPDIVILPEMREQAAAKLANEGAAKKQRVYVGLEASDIFSALRKWVQLVDDPAKVAGALLAITNQRLVRKLCPSCKQPYKPDSSMLRKLNLPADTVLYRQPEPEYDKKGNPIICQHCQGAGYVGRTAIIDLLAVDDTLRDLIRTGRSLTDIQSYALKQGGAGLQKQAIRTTLAGVTSIQEITRVLRSNGRAASRR